MKFGCCGSLSLSLMLLALLETITLVLPQPPTTCPTLDITCAQDRISICQTLATGKESSTVMCSIDNLVEVTNRDIDWYFTRTTEGDATLVDTIATEKYVLRGEFGQQLVVNNVSVEDDGYYFCRIRQIDEVLLGTCLEALAPAIFQTCSEGEHIPQQGCPGTQPLNREVGDSVTFDIALAYSGRNETCHVQEIQMISLSKDGNSTTLASCSGTSCADPEERLEGRLSVSMNGFNITVTLNNLMVEDSGDYTAVANIRSSSNARVIMDKNFTLIVSNPTTSPPTTTDEPQTSISTPDGGSSSLSQNTLIAIVVVIVILVLLLVGLGVFVVILLYWTYKHRGEKKADVYETIRDALNFRRDKKKSNGVSLTEPDGTVVYQRRSYMEEEKIVLPDGLNSESNPV